MRALVGVVLLAGLCPAQDLAAAVDLDTPEQRRKAARELARNKDVSLDQWLAAARGFGRFGAMPAGPTTYTVPLRVLRAVEPTKITVYVPERYRPGRPAPLMVVSHMTGMRGTMAYGQWRGIAERVGMLLLCPWEMGPNKGYGFTERERASTLAALRWARRRYNVDENRIHLGGGGRGGHLSWDLALRRRDRFAALAVLSGAPCMVTSNGANNLRYLENVADLPIRCLIGAEGERPALLDTVPPVFARLARWGAPKAKLVEDARGFAAQDWDAFFAQVRDPRPRRVVRAYARRGEGRAFWAEALAATDKVQENFRLVATQEEARGMDDAGYLRFMQQKADERTGRLEVERVAPGHFIATGKYVRTFRLLLDRTMFQAGKDVRVVFNGKEHRRRPRPSAAVLLTEFAERFDRAFLPVVELRFP